MKIKKSLTFLASTVFALSASSAYAGKPHPLLFNPNSPSLTIVNTISDVDGQIGGFVCADGSITGDPMDACGVETILYPIAGEVYATITDGRTGQTLGAFSQEGSVSATVEFDVSFFGLANPDWSVLPATMPWTMQKDFSMNIAGSTFELEEDLTGRAFPQLGPVEDPMVTGTLALRMAGCAGLRETSGQGDYAGKVGTLCMNGTFTFQPDFVGTGVSNCTIAIHDPLM